MAGPIHVRVRFIHLLAQRIVCRTVISCCYTPGVWKKIVTIQCPSCKGTCDTDLDSIHVEVQAT